MHIRIKLRLCCPIKCEFLREIIAESEQSLRIFIKATLLATGKTNNFTFSDATCRYNEL